MKRCIIIFFLLNTYMYSSQDSKEQFLSLQANQGVEFAARKPRAFSESYSPDILHNLQRPRAQTYAPRHAQNYIFYHKQHLQRSVLPTPPNMDKLCKVSSQRSALPKQFDMDEEYESVDQQNESDFNKYGLVPIEPFYSHKRIVLKLDSLINKTPYTIAFCDRLHKCIIAQIPPQDSRVVSYDISDITDTMQFDEVAEEQQADFFKQNARFKLILFDTVLNPLQGKSNYFHIEKNVDGELQSLRFRASYTADQKANSYSDFIFKKCNDCNLNATLKGPVIDVCPECDCHKIKRYFVVNITLLFGMMDEYKDAGIIDASYIISR